MCLCGCVILRVAGPLFNASTLLKWINIERKSTIGRLIAIRQRLQGEHLATCVRPSRTKATPSCCQVRPDRDAVRGRSRHPASRGIRKSMYIIEWPKSCSSNPPSTAFINEQACRFGLSRSSAMKQASGVARRLLFVLPCPIGLRHATRAGPVTTADRRGLVREEHAVLHVVTGSNPTKCDSTIQSAVDFLAPMAAESAR